MNISLASLVVLVCRSEIEKTPKIVYPHEVLVLNALHGENKIETTDEKSPNGTKEVDTEVEFQRLLDEYKQPGDKPHPVIEVFGNYDGFVEALQGDKPRRGRPAKAE